MMKRFDMPHEAVLDHSPYVMAQALEPILNPRLCRVLKVSFTDTASSNSSTTSRISAGLPRPGRWPLMDWTDSTIG
jgi:hypothetical protein